MFRLETQAWENTGRQLRVSMWINVHSSRLTSTGVHSRKEAGNVDVHLKHIRMNARERKIKEEAERCGVMQSDRKREAKAEFIIFQPSLVDS